MVSILRWIWDENPEIDLLSQRFSVTSGPKNQLWVISTPKSQLWVFQGTNLKICYGYNYFVIGLIQTPMLFVSLNQKNSRCQHGNSLVTSKQNFCYWLYDKLSVQFKNFKTSAFFCSIIKYVVHHTGKKFPTLPRLLNAYHFCSFWCKLLLQKIKMKVTSFVWMGGGKPQFDTGMIQWT